MGILGPRQCGKSTLAKKLLDEWEHSLYLDLERPSDLDKLRDPEYFLELHKDKLICLDEVQRKPEIFQVLRALIDDERRPGRFLLLGSASQELIQQSTETLAGRIKYLELSAFHAFEVPEHQSTEEWWMRGGFPDSLFATSDELSFDWRESFIKTFLERDLSELNQNISSVKMHRFWTMLAHYHGQQVNYSKLGQALDVSNTTVKRWLDILEMTYMVRVLRPLEVNVKKRLVKSPKVYIRDSGVLHGLLDIESHEDLLGHPVAGASWEGLALESIIGLQPRWTPSYYRTSNGEEVDLIMERKGKRVGYEFKISKSANLAKHIGKTMDILNLDELVVVTPVDMDESLSPKISICGLRRWCTKCIAEKSEGVDRQVK